VTGFLRLELGRSFRDPRYLVLAIAAPVGFYLLFASIFTGRGTSEGQLPAQVEIMVAMAAFGAMWGALSATAPRLARDRESGWLRALEVTPLTAGRVLAARIVAGVMAALPAIVAVAVTAVLAHHVALAAWQWAAGLGLLWAGTLPFVALGIVIGSLTSSTTAYALTTALYFALAALGGLWVPPAQFSPALRHIAATLPSYNLADLGWRVAGGSAPSLRAGLILAGWTAGLTALALAAGAHRRPRRSGGDQLPGPPAGEVISLSQLSKCYGPVRALDQIDLRIRPGTPVALLGPNGAGKSTAIELMLGLLDADHGSAFLFGSSPAQAIAAGRVGAMLQDTALMSGVSVGALLRVIRDAYPHPADLPALIQIAGLDGLLRRRTDQLSAGESQRVRFALAASGDPQLIVLDEPTVAMDVRAREAFWGVLRTYAASGRTILFSTHYLEEADTHAGRIILLRSGHIIADGSPDQVKSEAGVARTVRFRSLAGSPDRFRQLSAVTAVHADADRITLLTADADATVWALYDLRDTITELAVTEGGLQEAFLALTSAADPT
jgi:ABC-type multidrug transport system ATPase subunit/ABC-type multidrug transport system permease subunit